MEDGSVKEAVDRSHDQKALGDVHLWHQLGDERHLPFSLGRYDHQSALRLGDHYGRHRSDDRTIGKSCFETDQLVGPELPGP